MSPNVKLFSLISGLIVFSLFALIFANTTLTPIFDTTGIVTSEGSCTIKKICKYDAMALIGIQCLNVSEGMINVQYMYANRTYNSSVKITGSKNAVCGSDCCASLIESAAPIHVRIDLNNPQFVKKLSLYPPTAPTIWLVLCIISCSAATLLTIIHCISTRKSAIDQQSLLP